MPRHRIEAAANRLGFVLPDAMTDLYLIAGAAPELQEHNRLRRPEDLEVEHDFLVFMEENQNVVCWGIRLPAGEPDPEVWQRANEAEADWYSEDTRFSDFIVKYLEWLAPFRDS